MTSPAEQPFTVRREPGTVVVSLHGDLDLAGSVRLGAALGDLIDGQGNLHVTVDLDDVGAVDPAGLGVLAAAAKLVRHHGGALTVQGLPAGEVPGAPAAAAATGWVTHQHLVEFYDSEDVLAQSVRGHLEPGLQGDEAAVVVATLAHRDRFEVALGAAGVDVGGARAGGRYVDLDAHETLSRFMAGGTPDPGRFHRVVGGLVATASGPGRPVRIYGEMVAVLWEEGHVPAAIALEDLWNDLGRSRPFSLLCAYPVTAFDVAESTGLLRLLCDQHSPVAETGA